MTRKLFTPFLALALLLGMAAFTPTVEAQTSTALECTYNSVERGCRKQIVYVDSFAGDANTYSGVVLTPDGLREAECTSLNAHQNACILGELLCTTDRVIFTISSGHVCSFSASATPNPQPGAGCPDGYVSGGVVQGIQVCNPTPTPQVVAPIPTFTG